MKKLIIAIMFIVNLIGQLNCMADGVFDLKSNTAISMIKSFYTAYIAEVSQTPPKPKNIELIKKKYCTSKFLNRIRNADLDFDPFLKAQDCDMEVLKSLVVAKNPKTSDTYLVSYIDKFNDKKIVIEIKVQNENGQFKICNVW